MREELGERTLADEADAGAVALVVHGQRALARDAPHLGLGEAADREQRPREQRARHGVQEIGLVLGAIARRAAGAAVRRRLEVRA